MELACLKYFIGLLCLLHQHARFICKQFYKLLTYIRLCFISFICSSARWNSFISAGMYL